jgi:hypothetical protein
MLRKIFSFNLWADVSDSSLSFALLGFGLWFAVDGGSSVWYGLSIGLVGLALFPPIYKRLPILDSFIKGRFGLAGVFFVMSVLSVGRTIGRAQGQKDVLVQLLLGNLVLDLPVIALTSAYMFHGGFRQKILRSCNAKK